MTQALNIGLECASCGTHEKVYVVCHHCGRPLCNNRENCFIEIEDEAFGNSKETNVIAVHCNDCWQTYHPNTRIRQPGISM